MGEQHNATGTFEVKLEPLGQPEDFPGRMSIHKTFSGDLEGTSEGQMMSLRTETPGSAGYVALERVTGSLQGRKGSFALQHSGLMDRGDASLTVLVLPDSATEQLKGLRGSMQINIEEGVHHYEFAYSFST